MFTILRLSRLNLNRANVGSGWLGQSAAMQLWCLIVFEKFFQKSVDEAPNKKTKVENSGSSAADAGDVHKQLLAAALIGAFQFEK